MQKY